MPPPPQEKIGPPPLNQAAVQWVYTTLENAQPQEGATRELAESLVAIAEAKHFPIEDLVEWIATNKSGDVYAFDCWCDKGEFELLNAPARCGHCGAAIRSHAEAGSHRCEI